MLFASLIKIFFSMILAEITYYLLSLFTSAGLGAGLLSAFCAFFLFLWLFFRGNKKSLAIEEE